MAEIVTVADTYRMYLPPADESGNRGRVGSKLVHGEPYERKLLQDIRNLGLSGTAFDVGAHIGNHSLYLAAVCGLAVHAWEPFEDSRKMFQENLALNPDLDITVHDWAAGAEESRARFTTGMWLEFDPHREGSKLTLERGHVPVRRIDDALDVDDLVVMKIDVEGMEHDVIEGARGHIERCLPVIYCEAHTRTASRKVGAVLEPLGYRCAKTIRMGSPMDKWVPQ